MNRQPPPPRRNTPLLWLLALILVVGFAVIWGYADNGGAPDPTKTANPSTLPPQR